MQRMGYVELESYDGWEEEVWHLLNWSCWNYIGDDEEPVKPDNVHSPLTHCDSNIILQVEGSDKYLYAKHFCCGETKTLEQASAMLIHKSWGLWPFQDCYDK